MSIPEQESRPSAFTPAPNRAATRGLLLAHGLFYLVGGAWPIVSLRSFEAVTGAKTDKWLVKTTGLLVTVIGAALLDAFRRKRPTREMQILAIGSAASLAAIDFTYVGKERISPVYLLDGVAELGLAIGWTFTIDTGGKSSRESLWVSGT